MPSWLSFTILMLMPVWMMPKESAKRLLGIKDKPHIIETFAEYVDDEICVDCGTDTVWVVMEEVAKKEFLDRYLFCCLCDTKWCTLDMNPKNYGYELINQSAGGWLGAMSAPLNEIPVEGRDITFTAGTGTGFVTVTAPGWDISLKEIVENYGPIPESQLKIVRHYKTLMEANQAIADGVQQPD